MRPALFATTVAFAFLAACGGPGSSQANNAQANIAGSAQPPAAAAGSSAAVTPLPTTAPASRDEALKIMHERHEGMEHMGDATKAIGRELKAATPDVAKIAASAEAITGFAPKVPSLFPPGTGPDVGKTGAKPEIWQTPEDFAAKAHDFQLAAQAFASAVSGGDAAAIKTSFGDLGKSCKACHDKYRAKMKH
jgi:cytochrome c556